MARHCHNQFDSTPVTVSFLLPTEPPCLLFPMTADTTNSPTDPNCLHDTLSNLLEYSFEFSHLCSITALGGREACCGRIKTAVRRRSCFIGLLSGAQGDMTTIGLVMSLGSAELVPSGSLFRASTPELL
ncbi:hypothetical protein T265_06488 [Opisthorchis viverrini]|uniref:Uncharacterized protein n=1 Tax=Opisthorchis viverrini TaxID=6198 RepID=A0A074ZS83_OPIVI|nr:hypothetical protein T265_06488 [Opisthorchis viverrini]KER26205.1 hypothetical protein T265_06488 [Opisthorchis viverrini]